MKHIRRLLAVCLCLMLISAASVASAAVSKTFTKAPTLKLSFSSSVESDGTKELTVNASVPGFLTVKLLSADGYEIMTLVDNKEIRSGNNVFDFVARDENENPMTPGEYLFSASMINQFDVASAEVTREFKIREMSEETQEAVAARLAIRDGASRSDVAMMDMEVLATDPAVASTLYSGVAGSTTADGATVNGLAGYSAAETVVAAAPVATPVPNEVTYAAGTYSVGDEGLMIGVGVNDTATQQNAGYWGLTAAATDAEIWAALTKTMIAVSDDEKEAAYIYNSTASGRKQLGTVSGFSQGLNLIVERDDGWSLVEAFRNEDGAFIRGYIRTNKLRTIEPDQNYGMVIDKASQTLIVYKDGVRVGSTPICTGLPTTKYLHRETPAGEFVIATRRGTTEYYGQGYSKYTIRINGSYHLSQIPTTKKNGSNYSILQDVLGNKATRGNICVAHTASADGGINAEWIWNMTDGRKRVKVLIFDDKPRTDVPVGL